MDFSALNTSSSQKTVPWWVVGGLSILAAGDAVTPGFPFPGSAFIMVPLAGAAWVAKANEYGVFSGQAASRTGYKKNPALLSVVLGAGALATAAAVGTTALIAYKAYSKAEEREPAIQAVEESPVLSLLNPVIGAAAGAAFGYASGQPVWKGTLYGLFFAMALKRLAVEVIYSRSKVK